MGKKKLFHWSIAIIIIGLATYFKFGEAIHTPNQSLFADHGDGLRAYYVAKYHVENDTSTFHTSTFNYPFGENIFYTDSQPIITSVVKALAPLVDFSPYLVGIIHIAMILGMVFGAFMLILIFKKYSIPVWIAALIAVGLCLLSPQNGRFSGHFSMSYMFAIPAVIYGIICMEEGKLKRTTFWLLVLGLFLAGTHMYLFAMYELSLLIYWIFKAKKLFSVYNKKILLYAGLQLVFPVVVYFTLVALTDSITDRTSYPAGFFYYMSHPAMIFFPMHKPYLRFFNDLISVRIQWEGYAYIGISATLVCFVLSYKFLEKMWRNRFKSVPSFFGNKTTDLLLLIALLILLYSFTFPFNFGLQWLIKWLGPIRQIRVVGRFAWVFYYTVNLFVFIYLYRIRYSFKGIRLDRIVFFLAIFILILEGYSHSPIGKSYNKKFESFTNNHTVHDSLFEKIKEHDYQAIYPIHYFYIGPPYIPMRSNYEVIKYSYLLSYKCGLPLAGNSTGRTSKMQAFHQLEPHYSMLRTPPVFERYSEKDVLLLADSSNNRSVFEKELLKNADSIATIAGITLLEISMNTIKDVSDSISKQNRRVLKEQQILQVYNKPINYDSVSAPGYITSFTPLILEKVRKDEKVFEYNLPDTSLGTCNLDIWIGGMVQDKMLVTDFYIKVFTKEEQLIFNSKNTVKRNLHTLLDDMTLLKIKCKNLPAGGKLIMHAENKYFTNQELIIYNISITSIKGFKDVDLELK